MDRCVCACTSQVSMLHFLTWRWSCWMGSAVTVFVLPSGAVCLQQVAV